MSDLKGSKSESKTKNFNMGFQKKRSNYESSLFFAKNDAFKRQQSKHIIFDHTINEFEPYDLANVDIKVTKEGEVKDKTGLKITEFAVTESREKLIQLTLIIPRCY